MEAVVLDADAVADAASRTLTDRAFVAYPRRAVVALTQRRRIGDVSLTTRHRLAPMLNHVDLTGPSLPTAEMTFNTDSKYPTRRAYVVKVRGDARPDALAGRLENLVTGRQREFASGRELLESIASDLEATLHERPSDAECK